MENLSVEERKKRIIELAGDDISVAINLSVAGEISAPAQSNVIMSGIVMYQDESAQPSE